jgi:predicted nucleic acid-binding Zn ribbon protein
VNEPVRIGDALDGVVRDLRDDRGVAPVARQLGGLFGGWDEAVGPAVAEHVQPLRLDDGVLVVGVDDPAWATQIQLLESSVRARLGEIAGVRVDRLEVRVQRRR